ncbi:unnamed protein product [Blepharisma stoltei]|uniref:Uncharacterized protein n=1 Tax=Blepharisma stoltei TaxID=1481888 RepID=A0AAU9IR20_9CILI|nr:unnamed protein product [Blepharisma stoltei]
MNSQIPQGILSDLSHLAVLSNEILTLIKGSFEEFSCIEHFEKDQEEQFHSEISNEICKNLNLIAKQAVNLLSQVIENNEKAEELNKEIELEREKIEELTNNFSALQEDYNDLLEYKELYEKSIEIEKDREIDTDYLNMIEESKAEINELRKGLGILEEDKNLLEAKYNALRNKTEENHSFDARNYEQVIAVIEVEKTRLEKENEEIKKILNEKEKMLKERERENEDSLGEIEKRDLCLNKAKLMINQLIAEGEKQSKENYEIKEEYNMYMKEAEKMINDLNNQLLKDAQHEDQLREELNRLRDQIIKSENELSQSMYIIKETAEQNTDLQLQLKELNKSENLQLVEISRIKIQHKRSLAITSPHLTFLIKGIKQANTTITLDTYGQTDNNETLFLSLTEYEKINSKIDLLERELEKSQYEATNLKENNSDLQHKLSTKIEEFQASLSLQKAMKDEFVEMIKGYKTEIQASKEKANLERKLKDDLYEIEKKLEIALKSELECNEKIQMTEKAFNEQAKELEAIEIAVSLLEEEISLTVNHNEALPTRVLDIKTRVIQLIKAKEIEIKGLKEANDTIKMNHYYTSQSDLLYKSQDSTQYKTMTADTLRGFVSLTRSREGLLKSYQTADSITDRRYKSSNTRDLCDKETLQEKEDYIYKLESKIRRLKKHSHHKCRGKSMEVSEVKILVEDIMNVIQGKEAVSILIGNDAKNIFNQFIMWYRNADLPDKSFYLSLIEILQKSPSLKDQEKRLNILKQILENGSIMAFSTQILGCIQRLAASRHIDIMKEIFNVTKKMHMSFSASKESIVKVSRCIEGMKDSINEAENMHKGLIAIRILDMVSGFLIDLLEEYENNNANIEIIIDDLTNFL